MFTKLFALAARTPAASGGGRPSHRFVPDVETLDERLQPSALVFNGDVYVWGTSGADTVTVSYAPGGVEVIDNGVRHLFTNTTSGRTLHFWGYEGNDYLRNTTGLITDADMGAGDDHAYGGYGNDTIVGGTGNDYIDGRWGSDFVKGDDGNDWLIAGDATDTAFNYVDGGGGDDRLYGAGGGDYMTGESGNDTLMGYGGDDVLRGGGGWDYLYGMDGNDDLDGGKGDYAIDLLYGGAGSDRLRMNQESAGFWYPSPPFYTSHDYNDQLVDYDPNQDNIYV